MAGPQTGTPETSRSAPEYIKCRLWPGCISREMRPGLSAFQQSDPNAVLLQYISKPKPAQWRLAPGYTADRAAAS